VSLSTHDPSQLSLCCLFPRSVSLSLSLSPSPSLVFVLKILAEALFFRNLRRALFLSEQRLSRLSISDHLYISLDLEGISRENNIRMKNKGDKIDRDLSYGKTSKHHHCCLSLLLNSYLHSSSASKFQTEDEKQLLISMKIIFGLIRTF
jgi:hypothetical protein